VCRVTIEKAAVSNLMIGFGNRGETKIPVSQTMEEICMSDIRPVSHGPSLDGYYQQLINHIHILRLAINANATGQGGDLEEKTQNLVHELVDELDELQRLTAPFIIALRQSLPSAVGKQAGF
jgi:hypothetical protein